MERYECEIRDGWQQRCEEVGFPYHSRPGASRPYWTEGVYYLFTEAEMLTLLDAARALHSLGVEGVKNLRSNQRVLAGIMSAEGVSSNAVAWLERDWDRQPPLLLDRIRIGWNPSAGSPVLLGYSAGSPAGLVELEAQRAWRDDLAPQIGQVSFMGEAVPAAFVKRTGLASCHVAFPETDDTGEEALSTVLWSHWAMEAGVETIPTVWEALSFDETMGQWLDHYGEPIRTLFAPKSLPAMLSGSLGSSLGRGSRRVQWVEPHWRMLLSSRFMNAYLWTTNKGNPLLLPTFVSNPGNIVDPVSFPISDAPNSPLLFQARTPFSRFGADGTLCPEFDVWLVDGEPSAVMVHEYDAANPGVPSSIVPHLVVP